MLVTRQYKEVNRVQIGRALDPSFQRLAIAVLKTAMKDATRPHWNTHGDKQRYAGRRSCKRWWEAKHHAYRLIFTGDPEANGLEEWCIMAGVSPRLVRESTRRKMAECPFAKILGWI